MASVQFHGLDSVLQAAQNRDCPNWAIFQGRQFLFKYEDGDPEGSLQLLAEILENLRHSTAVYTLQFYEEASKIKANTPHDGSFNFRLIAEEERQQRAEMYSARNSAILQRLESIENRLAERDEDADEEPGGIMGIIQDPEKLSGVVQIVQAFGALLGINKPQPAAISGIPETMQDEKIYQAIESLKQSDPKLAEHLTKLAHLAQTDPATFKMLIGMLDKM